MKRICCALLVTLAYSQVWADLPETVARVKPSVVLVGVYSATDSPRFGFRGTGFVVDPGNLVVTNAHVLPESAFGEVGKSLAIQVWTAPNEWSDRSVKIVALDRSRDLAVLGFEGPAVASLRLSTTWPSEGMGIAFIGFPIGGALGYSHVTHRGIISSIAAIALPSANSQHLNERAIRQLRSGSFDVFQLDATAYPGNSGGPIFDPDSGEVLGVINSVLIKANRESALSQPSGISYGIPIEHVVRLLRQVR